MVDKLIQVSHKLATKERANINAWFFKTGPGEYGEGDEFIGLTVPACRKIAGQFKELSLQEIKQLLLSKIHEHRLIALFILVAKFEKSTESEKYKIFRFYLTNSGRINNWDLVDSSADKIVGGFLLDKEDKGILEKLARSGNIWERRISIIATYQFIKERKEFKETFKIAEILINDKHDLIQKAVGWMLREVGKRISEVELVKFLSSHYKQMPRTMLRYSVERFQENLRKKYLSGLI